MADRKISDLTALTAPAAGDYLPIVDISEASAANKNKRITIEELLRGAPDGTAAAPSIGFESDPNTGIYRPGADQVAISTGGSGRLFVDSSGRVGVGNAAPGALLDLGSATVTQGYIKLRSTGSGAREANIYSPAGGGLTIDTNSYTYPVIIQADTVQFGTGSSGTERARIDSSGRLLVGTSTARSNFFNGTSTTPQVQIEGVGSNVQSFLSQVRNSSADADASVHIFAKSRGTALNSYTIVQSSDALGLLSFQGADGSEFVEAARIQAEVDGTPGANDMPGRLVFNTTADGAASPTERLRITSAGLVGVGTSSPSSVLHCVGSKDAANFTIGAPLTTVGGGAFSNYSQVTFENTSGSNANAAIRAYGNIWNSAGSALSLMTSSGGAPVDRLYINSAGNVGIGTTSPESALDVSGDVKTNGGILAKTTGQTLSVVANPSIVNGTARIELYGTTSASPREIAIRGDKILFNTSSASETARIDSSGRLLVGTSTGRNVCTVYQSNIQIETTQYAGLSIVNNTADTGPALLSLAKSRGASVGAINLVQANDNLGTIAFGGADGTDVETVAAEITCAVDGTPGANDMPGRLVFSTTADGASSPTERMRINSGGAVFINTTSYPGNGNEKLGISSGADGIWIDTTGAGGTGIVIDRTAADGDLINFLQAGAQEGVISVSGTTVTYGGGHLARWSQLPNDEDPSTLLKGTVMSNLDEMCEWGDEDNEQLNKTKVSDVEGDPNVAGVFVSTSFSDDGPLDFFVGMTGDMVIRIAEGVTVERGDLLMSAGDGTAKPQDDDIIRSKTVAKVTSANVSCTYDDGSYCVPCVLMAC